MLSRRWFRSIILYPEVQLRYAAFSVSCMMIGLGAGVLIAFRRLPALVQSASSYQAVGFTKADLMRDLLWTGLGFAIVGGILSFFLAIIISHKIVGPLYVYMKYLRALLDHKAAPPVHLRKGDEFTEPAKALEEITVYLEKLRRQNQPEN